MESTADQATMFGLDLHDQAQRAQVERALEGVAGMVAARLVPGFERPIDELHALVTGTRSPKQVVRDVQSLLYTKFDISIDHRVISVVQLEDDDPIASEDPPGRRVALTRVSVTQAAAESTVTVVVTDAEGIEHVGTGTGDVSHHRQLMATSAATVAAVADLVGDQTTLTPSGVEVLRCGGVDVALAVVDVRAPRTHVTLTGSALVRRGEVDATARAVLDALNRLFPAA